MIVRVRIELEQLLRLRIHEDDVRAIVRHEDRVGDVLENEVEAVALTRRVDLRQPAALHLALELRHRAAQVGDVAQHGDERALAR
jgi:hypothetical protein